jgi:hypothetical protein
MQIANQENQKQELHVPWLQTAGKGIVCNRSNGLKEKTFIGYYWGKL